MNPKKQRDDYVKRKKNPVYLPTTEIQTNITFYAYILYCTKNILDDSFSDDVKLNLDF